MRKTLLRGGTNNRKRFRYGLITALAIVGLVLVVLPAGASYTAGINTIGSTNYLNTTIGNTTTTGTANDNPNYLEVDNYTTSVPLTAVNISVYGTATTGVVNVSIYTDNTTYPGYPGTLLFPPASKTITTAGWNNISIPNVYLAPGKYWIAFDMSVLNDVVHVTGAPNSTGPHSGMRLNKSWTYTTPYPNPGTNSGWTVAAVNTEDCTYFTGVPIEGYTKATKVTLSTNNAVIQNISFYSHATGAFNLSIYSDSGGPNSLLWASANTSATAGRWNNITFPAGSPSSLVLQSGTYWLAWQWNSTNKGPSYTAGISGIGNYTIQSLLPYGPFPATWGTGTSSTEEWSEFLTYNAGPVSGFTSNVTSGLSPLAVQFNRTVLNDNATSWNWSPNSGVTWVNTTNANTGNLTYTYSSPGTYSVTEIAQNRYYLNTTTLSNYITVYNKTVTGFTSNVTYGLFPLAVQFNLTTMNNNATWVNWTWGDGGVSNTSTLVTFNASHLYNSGGTYTVSESAANPYNISIDTQLNYISPYASISLNESAINLALIPGSAATNISLGITVSANEQFTVSVADNTGRGLGQGHMGNYTAGNYGVFPLNTTLASPLGLAGTTNATAYVTAQTITPPILASGQTLYTGTQPVNNLMLTPNTFTQPVAYYDPVMPSGSAYRIDLLFTIIAP